MTLVGLEPLGVQESAHHEILLYLEWHSIFFKEGGFRRRWHFSLRVKM